VDASELYRTLRELVTRGEVAMPTVPNVRNPGAGEGRLLDLERLESYRRMGMLEELLSDYMPEITRLVERLEGCVARQDLPQALEVLHSLLGMSGEAGGVALYQLVRSIYVPMVEAHSWPAQPGWLEQIIATTAQTHHALNAHTATQAAS
jgi:two-component system CAI-1 autoinducer sensor kinase/phosphatase CqsS